MATILGIDPGYEKCGVAVSVDGTPLSWEVLKLPAKLSRAERRQIVVRRLREVGSPIDLVIIEQLWTLPGVSLSTAIIDFAFATNLPIKALNPRTWKKTLLGNGNAPKERSVEYAQTWTGDSQLIDHNAADAVCISICGARHPELLKKPE